MPIDSSDLPAPALSVKTSIQGDATVVHCTGKLIAGSTEVLHNEVKPLIPRSKRIVLDLTDVSYMDSMGLGTIISLYVSAKTSGCRLEVVNFSKRIRELFSITNALTLFEAGGDYSNRIP